MTKPLELLGFASGIAANNPDCGLGPWYLYYHPELFEALNLEVHWHPMTEAATSMRQQHVLPLLAEKLTELGEAVLSFAKDNQPFCVIGGDHSCAIGTWSAVAHANRQNGDIGLVWIDAHMDSHTPATSISQNIHGMPVACLLGEGDESLSQLFNPNPKIKPKNLCIIGLRSYEKEEAELLTRLGVTLFHMNDINQHGMQNILQIACDQVSRASCGVGISIDMDAIDPHDAPGVGCPEPNGIKGSALIASLQSLQLGSPLLGLEIAEYNPVCDQNGKTAKLLVDLIHAVYPGHNE